ncbi:hypothetical protein GGR56DRAFT_535248 [Xylariaceae sp. FL0804]|nr:hypothetical protein GGR56DRAFT_535248 [Xylariaceae sp. FL0804]
MSKFSFLSLFLTVFLSFSVCYSTGWGNDALLVSVASSWLVGLRVRRRHCERIVSYPSEIAGASLPRLNCLVDVPVDSVHQRLAARVP